MRIFHLLIILLLTLNSCQKKEEVKEGVPNEHLKPLEWLIGDWVDKDEHVANTHNIHWGTHKQFLYQKFAVKIQGKPELEGEQVIGWDPHNNRIRSWIFDSDGGFGEGVWRQVGDSWVVETSHVLSDGRLSSSINIYTPVNQDSYTWESVGREVGGEMMPNIPPVTVVRVKK